MAAKNKKTSRKRPSAPLTHSFDSVVVQQLRDDPKFAAAYLQVAMEDADDQAGLLTALRRLAKARGIAAVAQEAGVGREHLYRALSPKGNPSVVTLLAVTKALGLKLTLKAA